MNSLKQFIIDWIISVISKFDGSVESAVNVLTQNVFTGDMYNMAIGISNVIKPIALTIVGLCFVIEFIKITIRMDILKWEYGLTLFFKLVFAKAAMDISVDFLMAIYATAAEWIERTAQAGGTLGAEVGAAIQSSIENMGWQEALGLVCTMGICFLGIWICGIILVVIAYARMFELLIYISVSPLPCAFLPMEDSGATRIARRYFTTFAAVCLQGLFMVISIKLYQAICTSTIIPLVQGTTEMSEVMFNMLIGALVLVMAVIKSASWAKSIMDAL